MKLRTGFVSNSSSSSFVVAVKKNGKATGKIIIKREVDLKQYADETITTTEQLYEHYLEWHGEKEDWYPEDIKSYKKALKEIANGKIILAGRFCDENEAEESLLCMEGLQSLKSEDMTVIHSEAGY